MSKKFYETSTFLSLNKKWQKVLAETGFDDIEGIAKDSTHVEPQQFGEGEHKNSKRVARAAKIISTVNFQLETYRDGTPKSHHRQILELYADGKTYREIADILCQSPDSRVHMRYPGICKLINRYLAKAQKVSRAP